MDAEPATSEQVYVIGSPSSTLVKIGRSTNLEQRIADLQRMSPVPLKVLCTYDGGAELEAALHRYFKDCRSHGEWFALDGDPVVIAQAAIDHIERAEEEQRRQAADRARARAQDRARARARAEEQAREDAAKDGIRFQTPGGPQGLIYRLRDPRDGTIRYVGSTGSRRDQLRRRLGSIRAVPRAVQPWIEELREAGMAPDIEIVRTVGMGFLPTARWQAIEAHRAEGHPLLAPAPSRTLNDARIGIEDLTEGRTTEVA